MSAPAVPLCAVACVEEPRAPSDADAPGILLPTIDLEEVDALVKRSVEARLVAVAAIAETQYTCDVADLMLERLGWPARHTRR
jgi:hypothetical protein